MDMDADISVGVSLRLRLQRNLLLNTVLAYGQRTSTSEFVFDAVVRQHRQKNIRRFAFSSRSPGAILKFKKEGRSKVRPCLWRRNKINHRHHRKRHRRDSGYDEKVIQCICHLYRALTIESPVSLQI